MATCTQSILWGMSSFNCFPSLKMNHNLVGTVRLTFWCEPTYFEIPQYFRTLCCSILLCSVLNSLQQGSKTNQCTVALVCSGVLFFDCSRKEHVTLSDATTGKTTGCTELATSIKMKRKAIFLVVNGYTVQNM